MKDMKKRLVRVPRVEVFRDETCVISHQIIGDMYRLFLSTVEGKDVGWFDLDIDGEWVRPRRMIIMATYRNKGYGTAFYNELFKILPENIKGIISSLSGRMDKVALPKLVIKFNGYFDGDIIYIPKPAEVV